MKILSNSFKDGEILPNNQVLDMAGGKNLSPQLSFLDIPQAAKSLALICHDKDAPRQNGWYHWLVLNIPVDTKEFLEGQKIPYLETVTDFGYSGYGGAAPPVGHGFHHYRFTIYALNKTLDINKNTPPKEVEDLVKSNSIDEASITAIYRRD